MVQLSLLWIGLGMLIGLMVCGAWSGRVRFALPANSPLHRVPVVVLVMLSGAVIALAGGWLSVLLVGQFFATAMALWMSIVGALIGLWGMQRLSYGGHAG